MDLGRIRVLAEEQLSDSSQFIVQVLVTGRHNPRKVLVVVDSDKGITIEACAVLSRKITHRLNEEGVIDGDYRLEVSSPGLDQPLKLKRQYHKNVGRKLRVTHDGVPTVGKLLSVDDKAITLNVEEGDEKEVTIPFEQIEKTFVLAAFK